MLLSPTKESQENTVDMKGLSASALQHMIDFIYTGQLELDFENLIEMLNAASHLQIQTALELCSDYMITLLTFSNADELLNIAEVYSLARVTEFYNNKVLHNFEEFSRTNQFLMLSPEQITRYLADDNLRIRSEGLLLDVVAKWYSHDQKRAEHLEDVVKNVRLCLVSDVQLVQLQQHWLSRQFPKVISHRIVDGIKYHQDSSNGHPWLSETAKIRSTEKSLVLIHQGSAYKPFEVTAFDEKEGKFYQLSTDISGSRDCRVATIDNFVYICRVVDCGGGALMNSLLRFDPRHLALQELTPCRRLRIDPALVSKGQWLYVFGGTNETYAILDSVECYDVRSNSWVDLLPMPEATHSHAATVCGDYIYLSGGVSCTDRQPSTNLFRYMPSSHQWETLSGMRSARRLHEMAALGDKLYIVGGIGSHSFHQQTQIPIECYNTQSDQWTLLTSTLAGRSVGHFIKYFGQILSIGREHYEATEDDLWLYDIETDTWNHKTKAPRRTGLTSAFCTMMYINFFDEKVAKRVLSDKR
ncbi:hypothetical protein LSH36_748g02090 [Paralvinella palmiformis]|uniref:BACK domain-containing protein n=1 Tax=Paralvinella palmiformis TaxID=53620 RepID=A0AAD9J0Q3_9ANNE|nr:hypothetical protein LSH36_748g02090 [Paralvinella palmiformis]